MVVQFQYITMKTMIREALSGLLSPIIYQSEEEQSIVNFEELLYDAMK